MPGSLCHERFLLTKETSRVYCVLDSTPSWIRVNSVASLFQHLYISTSSPFLTFDSLKYENNPIRLLNTKDREVSVTKTTTRVVRTFACDVCKSFAWSWLCVFPSYTARKIKIPSERKRWSDRLRLLKKIIQEGRFG